jgi:3-phenylpropionate/trans-cinnamate dioxygenase ferredoxin reductase component
MDRGMVIIGAGEAGARAASSLREQGFAGSVTMIGDEQHQPYERPPLSKEVMTSAAEHDSPRFTLDRAKLASQSITHLSGIRAEGIDRDARRVLLADGRVVPYAKLLISTGAGPRRLPMLGGAQHNVLYLRTFADALGLRSRLRPECRLVVIGGGFIGLEIAASARSRGCSVTLVEMAPRILMRGVPGQVAVRVAERHRRGGVALRTGVGIKKIDREADGIGAVPETRLAEAAGLAVENGIRVDGNLRTDDDHIYAAGDCCSFPHPLYGNRRIRLEAWRNAQDQGNVAAANMLGQERLYDAVPWFWSDQYDETLQVAGLSDEANTTVDRDLGTGRLFFHLAKDGRLVAASGVGPNSVIAKDIRLAEMLIARRAYPQPAALSAAAVSLKSLLRS